MYFASIKVPEGILRLENDFRGGKPWIRIYTTDMNGLVDWRNSLFVPISMEEIANLYYLVINNIQDVFTINKQNSSLTISLGQQIQINISYNQSSVTTVLSQYSDIIQFQNWVRFSVEQFPGLVGLFQDLLYILKPEYFEERKREMEQWKARNGYGTSPAYTSNTPTYNNAYSTPVNQPPVNNTYNTPSPTYNKPTYNANTAPTNKNINQGYKPPVGNQPTQPAYRPQTNQSYNKPNAPVQDDWTNSVISPDEDE
jgi:hypothetical protein